MQNEFDVVVVGGGNAGLCAALMAARNDRSVMLIEKSGIGTRGGNSKYTRDIRYAHDNDSITTGPYTEEEFLNDLLGVTRNQTNMELAQLTVKESTGVTEFMRNNGIVWQKPLKGTLHLSRTNGFFLGGGKALVNAYYKTARELGVSIAYGTEVEDILIDDGTFEGVRVQGEGGRSTIFGKAAVIASGGFEANIPWLEKYWGEAARNFVIRGSKFNDGGVLRKLLERGAESVGDPKGAHAVAVDSRSPKFDGGIVTRIDSLPFGIVVNREGKRFYDEGEDIWPKRYAIWGRLIAEQPGQIAFSIVDSKSDGLFLPTAYAPFTASSINELASKLHIDPSTLERTVSDFNAHTSSDCEFSPGGLDGCATSGIEPPKTHWARAIDSPPFRAYPLRPGITFTYMGVVVDRRARVTMRGGGQFRNVFAAGEVMAGNILTRGYLAGFGLTIGTVFGRIAGEMASIGS